MSFRVLIADDEELERRALGRILKSEGPAGLEILEAANGAEAVEASAGGPLDAAFLDIRMPGIDGIEAARLLREASPGLPIFFLTAHDSFEYARSALRLGVEDFLLKPASAAEVLGALARATSAAKARGEEAAGRDPADSARLESALSYLADELRASLSSGRIDDEGMARYAELRGGGRVLVAAVAAGTDCALPCGCSLAPILERALSGEGRVALAGSSGQGGPGGSSCLCAVAGGSSGREAEAWLRPALQAVVEDARAELGATICLGAVSSIPDFSGGRGPGGEALAKAALRALALAGGARPLVLLSIASSRGREGSLARDEAGSTGTTAARAFDILEARYAEDLSLDSVASELGVSPSYLSRLLGRPAGLGFADCLGRLRVEKAKAFLDSGKTSVKETAAMVGYRDPAYFARVFRRFCGLSPAEYRASRRAEGGNK